jgi:hypothetical protein
MAYNLSGKWKVWLEEEEKATAWEEIELQSGKDSQSDIDIHSDIDLQNGTKFDEVLDGVQLPVGAPKGTVQLPGILQSQGYGFPITKDTPWMSSLHDPLWYQREEYQYAQEEEMNVPFLAQPPLHYIGRAWYEKEVELSEKGQYFLFLECTKWRSYIWIDDIYRGTACSLCIPHVINLGTLEKGKHSILLCIDNRMQYPYRPDGHGISDALGATWNGVAGRIELLSAGEWEAEKAQKQHYAKSHPRTAAISQGKFLIDGNLTYFRGTHFGGDYPLTGYPATDLRWWQDKMEILKEWGFNFLRFHSYCPPEAAFAAADEAGIYLLVECGMWNVFEEGSPMLQVLRQEMQGILEMFGHHPSFVLFSAGNEPGGNWYRPLEHFVEEARAFDESLGYGGRRLYTPQSGWFYDKPPAEITGPDFLYFHRSAYGPFLGGNIRNWQGWKGRDYSPSLEGAKLPVICHEMGQWCAYPDFRGLTKFTGYMRPGHLKVFRENARTAGVLPLADTFAACSAENQFLLYKEDIEANLRTPQLFGYEMLDLRDYLGQGGALIGLLDAFWDSKGTIMPKEFRRFNQDTVVLARITVKKEFKYVFRTDDIAHISIELCHFGKEVIQGASLSAQLVRKSHREEASFTQCVQSWQLPELSPGKNLWLADWELSFSSKWLPGIYELILTLEKEGEEITQNKWDLTYFKKDQTNSFTQEKVLYTKDWGEVKRALSQGRTVLFTPWLSLLDYECPATDVPTLFWNGQMGPTWSRGLGLSIEADHPIFASFPTSKGGGWQWEDILRSARGYYLGELPEELHPMVRVIDDWNRNLSLALVWEAKVETGKLIFVSADLEGDYADRPAAYALRMSLLNYAASAACQPTASVTTEQIEKRFFPVRRMERLTKEAMVYEIRDSASPSPTFAPQMEAQAVVDPNPNASLVLEGVNCPLAIELRSREPQKCLGLYYLPDQRDRMHEGLPREVTVEVMVQGEWKNACRTTFANTYRSQKIYFAAPVVTDRLRLIVHSLYGTDLRTVWEERAEGFFPIQKEGTDRLQVGGIHLIWEEGDFDPKDCDNGAFWKKQQGSSTKEIEN